jgi:hypothetical protein
VTLFIELLLTGYMFGRELLIRDIAVMEERYLDVSARHFPHVSPEVVKGAVLLLG